MVADAAFFSRDAETLRERKFIQFERIASAVYRCRQHNTRQFRVIDVNRLHSSTCVWMQFYQLVQVLADVQPTVGTLHCSRGFFVHRDTASRTEPLAAEAVAFLGKSEVFRLLHLTHEP